jgi:LCP family protein required for cell wall assembly
MTNNEALIRQAIAAEADEAVDPAVVLATLQQGKRPRRRRTTLVVAVAGFAVVAGVIAVTVPLTSSREAEAPPAAVIAPTPATDQNVLLVGMDDYQHSDAIVLARFGADGSVRGVSVPRDTKADIPGYGMDRINGAYIHAYAAAHAAGRDEATANAEGAKSLVATVQALTGVRIDHYAAVDMKSFGQLSTAVGGVEVCLANAAKDQYSGADFPAGKQSLAGPSALAYLRQRHGLPNGDFDRIKRQQAFVRSLITKLAHGDVLGNPKALAELLASVRQNVRVDQSWDVVEFAKQLASASALDFGMIPVTLSPDSRDPSLLADPAAVRKYTEAFLAGKPDTEQPQPGGSYPPAGDLPCVN